MTKKIDINKLLQDTEIQKRLDDSSIETMKRRAYIPSVCDVFQNPYTSVESQEANFFIDQEARKKLPDVVNNKLLKIVKADQNANFSKKRKIGIVFSGGPSPGGHNVIAGVFDAAKKANPNSQIFGFFLGPDGIIEGEYTELTADHINKYRNIGGFSMIKTGRTKIDSEKKTNFARQTCKELELDAIVIIGGDDSNTNAVFLAQDLVKDNIQVIGIPKTIDGDVQVKDADGNKLCAISFGFHSAARFFANQISNLCTDSSSDVKYWHFCKVMGRVASHLALEVALQTHSNMTLIGEDIVNYINPDKLEKSKKQGFEDYDSYGMTLRHVSRVICDAIVRRAAYGKNYGILVIPEGILEFINEIQKFIIKLNSIIADYNKTHDIDFHTEFPTLENKLDYLRKMARLARENNASSVWNTRDDDLFSDIPEFFRIDLLRERDSHGNFPFSSVKTEEVLLGLVEDYLKILKNSGTYKVGIEKSFYEKTLRRGGLDPVKYGNVLFKNYPTSRFLLMRDKIISQKTLKQELKKSGFSDDIPEPITTILKKSIPSFKNQVHFYGYDGRGTEPTKFDCMYTYNLGHTAFSLIANNITGQMAAIKNIEKDFSKWEPIGIPLAPLMHLEERGGKLNLVMERTLVDIESPAFQLTKAFREKWLAANDGEDCYRKPPPIRFEGDSEEDRPITLFLNARAEELG